MKHIIHSLAVLLLFTACGGNKVYVPQDLRKLSNDEIILKVRNYELPDFEVIFRDQRGLIIDADSLADTFSPHIIFADTYVDENDDVVEVVIRDDQPLDSALLEKMNKATLEGPLVTPAEVDCSNLNNIIYNLAQSDQALRNGSGNFSPKDDLRNLAVAMGIIENCGMPSSLTHPGINLTGLWLVFQHAPHKYRKQYFHYFQKAAEVGDVRKSQIALMQDRILMIEKKPQLYGSQINGGPDGYRIYDLAEPEYVDQRRATMGLGPLSEYAAQWDITFDVPQKEK